jgi:hypothetical protein
VTYLTALSYVQAVGMVGVCTSSGKAAYLAAAEPRLKALATVAAFLPGPELYTAMYGEEALAQRRAASAASRRKYEETDGVICAGEPLVMSARVQPSSPPFAARCREMSGASTTAGIRPRLGESVRVT